MYLGKLWLWLSTRRRLLTYILGSLIITLWTLVRFFTKRSIFDLVTQQVIVHQWLHGNMSAAHMGQTAYVPKMLLLYVPLDLLPGSPRLKLILLTLLINIATFVLIGIVLEKILREFGVRIGGTFYAALLWLSAIAGSAFWIEFANSRNLEVAGGLLWVYLGIRYLRHTSWARTAGLVAFGGILFFDDPLQLYMSAVPLIAYAVVLVIAKQERVAKLLQLASVVVASCLVSYVLFALLGQWLQLNFTDTVGAAAPHPSIAWAGHVLGGVAKSLLSLFAGAADAGRLRELLNIGFVALGVIAFIYTVVRRLMPRRLLTLLACMVVVDVTVYVASGQAVGEATSRYLLMLVPIVVVALGAVYIPRAIRPYGVTLVAVLVFTNVFTLGTVLTNHWSASFPADAHLDSTYRYISEHSSMHIYASADTAMPLLYFHGTPAGKSLPLACSDGRLVQTYFSMNKTFTRNAAAPGTAAAIILDGDVITNEPSVCTVGSLENEFGAPLATDRTDDGSTVLIYTQAQVRL